MRKRNMIILGSILLIVVFIFAVYSYQAPRFNANITINQIKVGGLTAEQAINKLKSAESKNEVYVGTIQIYDKSDTKMEFTDNDRSEVENCLRKQRTFFPSFKASNYHLIPNNADPSRVQSIQKELEEKLLSMNKSLKPPQDAVVRLEQGEIVVTESIGGEQYDITGLIEEFQKQKYNSEIHLDPLYIQPIKADDPIINQQKNMLQDLVQRTVDYKVQDQVYLFKGNEIIKTAFVSSNMKIQSEIDEDAAKKKLNEINDVQSTLNKNYTFTTHSGSVISVKGQSYGWAINVDAESKRIQEALENGTKSISAYNVYGVGWNVNGVGYHTITNHGIGNTYVEVSIEDQRIWVYKDGELKVTTPVVTGTKIYNEDTPTGVWYIEYKQAPATLRGSETGNLNYSVDVKYWAPFTLSGCGFHDASWRRNWSSNAYIKEGSGGCVNIPPNIMKSVYDNLIQYEPVIIY